MTWEHDDPDSFAAGTVGQPGSRVFYLQSRLDGEVVSLKIEKQQVQALSEYLQGLLEDLPVTGPAPAPTPLVEPVIAEWTVGTIGVAYDSDLDRIVVVAEELVIVGEDDDPDDPAIADAGEQMRFALTREQVSTFITQVAGLVARGRPPCQICGLPMNPDGHFCPSRQLSATSAMDQPDPTTHEPFGAVEPHETDVVDGVVPEDPARRRALLEDGEVELVGRMPWSSNMTFLVKVSDGDDSTRAIYKPRRGERPLWDFEHGLDRREVAAYELSEALGWNLVPITVLRDGPHGQGSVQQFVDAQFEEHYFSLYEAERHLDRLQAMCAFDLVANNTDRKSGHCLLSIDGEVFGIDHGLCFHEDFKLRTVIWEFAGEPIPDALLADLDRFASDDLPHRLWNLLQPDEREALQQRARAVVDGGVFPIDPSGHRYPWPLV